MENLTAGKIMSRTGGVRKLRFAPPSRHTGKRGALRVCYTWFPAHSTVGLFMIYPKNEQDTLTDDDEAACRSMVKQLHTALQGS